MKTGSTAKLLEPRVQVPVQPVKPSTSSRVNTYDAHAAVYTIHSKLVMANAATMKINSSARPHYCEEKNRPIWGSSGRATRAFPQRSAVILPHPSKLNTADVRRSRSVTPVRHHYQFGSSVKSRKVVPSTQQQIQRFHQQHQKLHKSLAKTAAEDRQNQSNSRHAKLNNMRLSLRASGSDTMLQKHFPQQNSSRSTIPKQHPIKSPYHSQTIGGPKSRTNQKPFASAVIGSKNKVTNAEHFRDRSSSEVDEFGHAAVYPSSFGYQTHISRYPLLAADKPSDSLEKPGQTRRMLGATHALQYSNSSMPRPEELADGLDTGSGDFHAFAAANTFPLRARNGAQPKFKNAGICTPDDAAQLQGDATYCTCSDAEAADENIRPQQHGKESNFQNAGAAPPDDRTRFMPPGGVQQRPSVNFSSAPPTHYIYTPNQTLNSTLNGTILESHCSRSNLDAVGSPQTSSHLLQPHAVASSNFDDRFMKQAVLDVNHRLTDAASTREEVVILRTQLYDLLNKLAGMNALSEDFASTVMGGVMKAGQNSFNTLPNTSSSPRSPVLMLNQSSSVNEAGDTSFINGASTSTATYMSIERELQRLRCLVDIKDQQLERQQNTLDRRQLVNGQTNEQHQQMEKRMQQLEKHFDQQHQTLQQTYQTHLLEFERSNAELRRQLQHQQQHAVAAAAAPISETKSISAAITRETERVRYEYSQLRLEYDAEVRTSRDEQQKLRLQLNDMRHQVEQHATLGEEREKEWRRERKQLETDRDGLVEKLNQRAKQLSQLWNDHRILQEQFKDAAGQVDLLQRDKLRLEEEAKLLVQDARHFQREANESAESLGATRASTEQLLSKERSSGRQAVQDAVDIERQRSAEQYGAQVRVLEETIREQKRFIEQVQKAQQQKAQQTPIVIDGNGNNEVAADSTAKVLMKQQKSSREKVRKALLVKSNSDSEFENDDRRSPRSDLSRHLRSREERRQRSRSTNDMLNDPLNDSVPPVAAWRQQLQHEQAQAEYFRQQYEQVRITLEQRLAVHDSLRIALDEKTREAYDRVSEINRLKRQLRDVDETNLTSQRRLDDEMRHLRKNLDELRAKYTAKSDLCEQLEANIAQLHQRLGAAEHEAVVKIDEQKRDSDQRLTDMQKQLNDAVGELLQARSVLEGQKQQHQQQLLQSQAEALQTTRRKGEEESDAAAKQHKFSLRLAEQLQQMEARLAQAENNAGEWQQKLMNVQSAYEQVFGN